MEIKNINIKELITKPAFILFFTLAVIFIVGIFSVGSIVKALLHSRPEVVVPDLEGMRLIDALAQVSEMKFSLQQDGTEFDDSLPAGTILRQHPPTGIKVRTGRAIRVVISKGGKVVFVPSIIGKPVVEAQSILALDGLQVGALTEIYSMEFREGVAIEQDPSSSTVVTKGALVDVVVSKGYPPAGAPLLPDFYSQSAELVRDWAEDVGAQVLITEDEKAVGISGTVVRQDPVPGQPLLRGNKVRITIVPLLAASKGSRFKYSVPADRNDVSVKIMARDNRGESQVYKGDHKGGDEIEVPISVNSTTRFRIYLNDTLEEERVIEP